MKTLLLPLRLGLALFMFFAIAFSLKAQLPTASQVASQMSIGWNIGNSLEVPGGETGWGNPVVSQQLINAVKAAGFNCIRIPCAWDSHANASTYEIDASWLARVKQVVDYCIANNMYVVLNIHWDGGWLEEHPLYSYQTAVNQKQNAYWTQIANYFKSYNEHLLFAGTNEVHADYGTPTTEHIAVQQSYNQTFVNAVRATGGNNSTRSLVVQTYNTNAWHGINYFSLPNDPASNRLIVEFHHYDPYDFTLNTSGSCLYWGAAYPAQSSCTWAQESYTDDLFSKIKTKWINNGIPVIIGEYGVIKRTSLSGQTLIDHIASREYYLKYITSAAVKNGIKPFYWDNGVKDNGMALFDRNSGAVTDQGALNAVMSSFSSSYSLTTSISGSGSISKNPNNTTYSNGTVVTLTATAASGYVFSGWSGDLSGTTNPATITINGNKNVTAVFTKQTSNGSILREYWNNISGTSISSLTSASAYPNNPTGSEQLSSLEGPSNAGDNYGSRLRGYIHPPTTGSYTFWVAGDDNTELYLSTSDNASNSTLIASATGWTNSREWTKYSSQKSAAITLTAGQKYYIEVLHKEGTGGDNLAVAWQGPNISQAVISGAYLTPYVVSTSSGTVLREYWKNISGTSISNLTSNANYPNTPSGSDQLSTLEGPSNFGDNYGSRIRGYVQPPATGSYTFWIAGDDNTELYLSTNTDPANATLKASINGWTNSREWTKYSSQQSAAVNLTAGQKYYIEVLHKEGTGGDNVAVAWQGPGISQSVIAGAYLSPYVVKKSGLMETNVVENDGQSILLYPNPFWEEFNLAIDKPELVDRIEINNMLGARVEIIDGKDVKNEQKIGLSLKPGLYLVCIYSTNGVKTFKITKNR